MTADELGFLSRIIVEPDDDIHRLAYADWLDENQECWQCRGTGGAEWHDATMGAVEGPCGTCNGTGKLTARAARAEFIRVQCELWRYPKQSAWLEQMPAEQWAGDPEEGALLTRLAPLVSRHTELCRLHVRDCAGWSRDFIRGVLGKNWLQRSATWQWGWARGFISEIHCTAADWLAHADALFWHPKQTVAAPKCETCGGTDADDRGRWKDKHGHDYWIACRVCKGRDRVPRPCPPTAQPIRRVELTTPLDLSAWVYWGGHQYERKGRKFLIDGKYHMNRLSGLLEAEWPGLEFVLQ